MKYLEQLCIIQDFSENQGYKIINKLKNSFIKQANK